MTAKQRLDKYIARKKSKGQKRVSFFVDEKVWLRFKKYQSLNDFYSPNSFLKELLQNYANNQ